MTTCIQLRSAVNISSSTSFNSFVSRSICGILCDLSLPMKGRRASTWRPIRARRVLIAAATYRIFWLLICGAGLRCASVQSWAILSLMQPMAALRWGNAKFLEKSVWCQGSITEYTEKLPPGRFSKPVILSTMLLWKLSTASSRSTRLGPAVREGGIFESWSVTAGMLRTVETARARVWRLFIELGCEPAAI